MGFWSFKCKRNKAESNAIRFLVEQEVERLTIMSAIPVGTDDRHNLAGDPIVWDQAYLDALNEFLESVQAKLDALP